MPVNNLDIAVRFIPIFIPVAALTVVVLGAYPSQKIPSRRQACALC